MRRKAFWPVAYFLSTKPIKLQLSVPSKLLLRIIEIMTSFEWMSSKKNPLKKKLTIKIRAIYGISCVLYIADVNKNM